MVFLIDSCSVNSCIFGVPVGGGELRVFLLCHLRRTFSSTFFFQHIFTDACPCVGCCSGRAVAELHRDVREVLGGGSLELDFDGRNDRN